MIVVLNAFKYIPYPQNTVETLNDNTFLQEIKGNSHRNKYCNKPSFHFSYLALAWRIYLNFSKPRSTLQILIPCFEILYYASILEIYYFLLDVELIIAYFNHPKSSCSFVLVSEYKYLLCPYFLQHSVSLLYI